MELSNDLLKLTPREVHVLKLSSEGMTAREIADQFHISPRTVEDYRYDIIKKLRARCIAHAVLIGCRIGLIA